MLLFFVAATAVDSLTASPRTPTSAELAQAVASYTHKHIGAVDVRSITCEGLYYDPQFYPAHSIPPWYACKWEQVIGNGRLSYSASFDFDKGRWKLTERPDSDMPIDAASAEERHFRAWLIPHLRKELADSHDKLTYRYGYAFVDLNGDGRKEAIVTIAGRDTCGTGGCEMDVEVERDGTWHELSSTVRTRGPIKVLATKHHGWSDIGVFDAGGGMPKSFESAVTFNGRKYRFSPTDKPVPKGVHGLVVLTDKMINRPVF